MDENRQMTKDERKAARRLEKLDREKSGSSDSRMKAIILTIGSIIFIACFVFLIVLIKQDQNKPVVLSSDGWVRGSGTVTLTEFGDFQCPACKAYEPIVRNLSKDFKGKMKLQFKHFPLISVHPNALLAARAAEAAGVQNKFWEMHDMLYDTQETWSSLTNTEATNKFESFAKELGLDAAKFKKDLASVALQEKIGNMQNEGVEIGVNATPTFFLNNKKLETPTDYEAFKKVIQEEIDSKK